MVLQFLHMHEPDHDSIMQVSSKAPGYADTPGIPHCLFCWYGCNQMLITSPGEQAFFIVMLATQVGNTSWQPT